MYCGLKRIRVPVESLGQIFVDRGFFAFLWGCHFVDVVFSFSEKNISFFICFRQECKFVRDDYQQILQILSHHEF